MLIDLVQYAKPRQMSRSHCKNLVGSELRRRGIESGYSSINMLDPCCLHYLLSLPNTIIYYSLSLPLTQSSGRPPSHDCRSSSLTSWLINTKERKTIPAPIQYVRLDFCEFKIIWPTRDSGIVRLRPTATTNGEVKRFEYIQQRSETSEVAEFTWIRYLTILPFAVTSKTSCLPKR